MAVNPKLYELLAEAKAKPSGAFQTLQSALGAVENVGKGYLQGKQIEDSLRQRQLRQQTLRDALGGLPPEQGVMNLTGESGVIQHPNLAAYAAFMKANKKPEPKPGDIYNAEQTAAVASGDPAKLAAAFGGQVPRTAVAANTTASGVHGKNEFFGKKGGQIDLSQLPSELGPNTGAGAAYGVKIAARQGKALVANPGSAQRIALGSGDIARAVLRAAPQLDAQRGANFAENLATRWSSLTQKLTADPKGSDAPKIRKEMYDILDELDKSSTPFIQNHLANYESMLGPLPGTLKARELGQNIPDIPFVGDLGEGTPVAWKTARNAQGQTIRSKDNWATFEPVTQGQ